MSKKILIEGIDAEGLKQIVRQVVSEAFIEHLDNSVDHYKDIPQQLSTTEVKKYFGITHHRLTQLKETGVLNPINIGSKGAKRPTYKYLKSELIEYMESQKK
jgi:hypothetical protein